MENIDECGDKKDNRYYTIVHSDSILSFINAEYPGGEEALDAYILKAMKENPELAGKLYKETVYARITLSENGWVEKTELLKPARDCDSCNVFVVKVCNGLPAWKPALGVYKGGTQKKEKDQHLLVFPFRSLR